MSLTGDFGSLEDFTKGLESMKDVPSAVLLLAKPAIEAAVAAEFAAGADPTGEAWVPMAGGGGSPLSDLAGNVVIGVEGKSLVLTTTFPLNFHQHGTQRAGHSQRKVRQAAKREAIKIAKKRSGVIAVKNKTLRAMTVAKAYAAAAEAIAGGAKHDPARPILPEEDDAIPPAWQAILDASAATVMAAMGAR